MFQNNVKTVFVVVFYYSNREATNTSIFDRSLSSPCTVYFKLFMSFLHIYFDYFLKANKKREIMPGTGNLSSDTQLVKP